MKKGPHMPSRQVMLLAAAVLLAVPAFAGNASVRLSPSDRPFTAC